jgi:hypothetical protein
MEVLSLVYSKEAGSMEKALISGLTILLMKENGKLGRLMDEALTCGQTIGAMTDNGAKIS